MRCIWLFLLTSPEALSTYLLKNYSLTIFWLNSYWLRYECIPGCLTFIATLNQVTVVYISNTYTTKSQPRIWNLEYVVSGLFNSSKARRVRKSGTNFCNRCLEVFPLKCMCLLKFIYNLFSIGFKWWKEQWNISLLLKCICTPVFFFWVIQFNVFLFHCW